jgi:hypothetical protein
MPNVTSWRHSRNGYTKDGGGCDTWEEFFDQFAEYKRVSDRSRVVEANRKLSEWATRQRRLKKESKLPDEIKQRLSDMQLVLNKTKPYTKEKRYTDKQEKRRDEMFSA